MVERMWEANPHGGGIAWREGEGEQTKVHWKKGLDLDEMKRLCRELPTPYVAHFRIPSCGGDNKELNHPFPIHKDVSLTLEGKYKGYVLFHNGHWHRWKDMILEAAVKQGIKVPQGHWSDTRGMALMAASFGLGILEVIDEKYVAFGPGPEDLEIGGSGWGTVDIDDGKIWVSNKGWESKGFTQGRTRGITTDDGIKDNNRDIYGVPIAQNYCKVRHCTRMKLHNQEYCLTHLPTADDDKKPGKENEPDQARNFRPVNSSVQEGQIVTQAVQEGKGKVSEVDGQTGKRERSVLPVENHGPHALALVSGAMHPDLNYAIEALRWVRQLNPSRTRGQLRTSNVMSDDDARKMLQNKIRLVGKI